MGVTVHMTKESKLLRKCKKVGWMGEGGQGDINKELKLMLKLQNKKLRGVRARGGVRMDANDELKLL